MSADVRSASWSDHLTAMTPRRVISALASDLGLTVKDVQVILDTTPRNINRLVAEQAYPQPEARRRLAALMALHRHLGETFTAMEGARDWLRCPSRYLSTAPQKSWIG